MWVLGILGLILIFFASDGDEKVKMLLIRLPLLVLLILAFVANPILGIVVFLLIGYFGKNKLG